VSMLAEFRQVSPELAERLRIEPDVVLAVVDGVREEPPGGASDVERFIARLPADLRAALDGMTPDQRTAFLVQAEVTLAEMPDAVRDVVTRRRGAGADAAPGIGAAELGADLHLEKAWHGVHWLLCGTADEAPPPLGDAVLGGEPVGADLGYGPARLLGADRVAPLATELGRLTDDELGARFDAGAMEQAGIYPSGWSEPDRRDWLLAECRRVRAFYAGAATRDAAVLLWLA